MQIHYQTVVDPEREEDMNAKLRAVRESLGFTQAAVAKLAQISEVAYQRYEYEMREPNVRTAIRIADALNIVDLRQLFAVAPDDASNLSPE